MRVIWSEGILLSQQHLQQFELALERERLLLYKLCHNVSYGVYQLEIDPGILDTGVFRVHHCIAVLPGGHFVNYRWHIRNNLEINLSELAKNKKHTIYLHVSKNNQVSTISGYESYTNTPQWKGFYSEVEDIYDSSRTTEMLLAELNLSLSTSPSENSLSIGRIQISEEETCRLDYNSIFPCLSLQGCSGLFGALEKFSIQTQRVLLKKIGNKAVSGILARMLAYIQNEIALTKADPFSLYKNLSMMLREIENYSNGEVKTVWEAYEHEKIEKKFILLFEQGYKLIQSFVVEENEYPFQENQAGFLVCSGLNREKLKNKNCFLRILTEEPFDVDAFLLSYKMGSLDELPCLVANAISGIHLSLHNKPNSHHVDLLCKKEGEYWSHILDSGMLALFVKPVFKKLKFWIVMK